VPSRWYIYYDLERKPDKEDGVGGGERAVASSRAAPGGTAEQAFSLQIPDGLRKNLESALERVNAEQREFKIDQPLRVDLIKDGELTSFEKKTVRLGYWGSIIAACSLVAACVAAWVVFGQFKEMAGQTDLMDIASRQARRDSAEASAATAKQLQIAQQQADAAQEQVAAVTKEMRLDQRAWVVATTFSLSNEPEVNKEFRVNVSVTNTGKTPAIKATQAASPFVWPNEPPRVRFLRANKGSPVSTMVVPASANGISFDSAPLTLTSDGDIYAYTHHLTKVYVEAIVWYSDVFGNPHWTRICAYHTYGDALTKFSFCTKGNEVDTEENKASKPD
jgi:hypothetical protein